MDFEYIYPIIVLFGSFAIMLAVGVPITFAIGLSSLFSILIALPRMRQSRLFRKNDRRSRWLYAAGDPFCVSRQYHEYRGIARRLVNLAQALVGRLPGSLAHCNILANTLFGAISGSAVASAAAVGGIMSPLQEKEGYSPAFSTAINVASAPIGLMIPPSNVLIVYSLASGGTSVAALFLAGYLPGILTALALMTVAALYAHRHHYPVAERINLRQFLSVFRDSLPSLLLIFIIIGGIIGGVFTPTEASAIAVIYSLALAAIYREINVSKLRDILLDSVVTSSIVLLLVGCSMGMSWAMTNADVPELINEMITSVSENKWVILLIINLILLFVGTFMDITPAILIFTPIFLPIAQHLGIDPVHFGIIMVFNLTIGLCTPR